MKPSKYIYFAKMGLRKGFQYRANALSGIGATFISLILFYYVWKAIAASGTLSTPFSAIISYVALAQVINNSTSVNAESWIGDRVREGTIVNELKRPVSMKAQIYFSQLGESAFTFFTRGLPALFVGILFLNIGIPTLGNSLLFALSIGFTLNLAIMVSYTISMLVFWTKIGWSLRMIRFMLTSLLSGAMIPLYLLPGNLKQIFYLTPFPSMVDAPISIYQGTAENVYAVFGTQIFWILALFVLSELLWKKAKKKITVQGG